MSRKTENTGFVCENCGAEVRPLTNGSFRNHCPFCLHSKHVDEAPGDRESDCGGIMAPVGIEYSGAKGYQIVHECKRCGKRIKNKVAEDTDQPDDRRLVFDLMARAGR